MNSCTKEKERNIDSYLAKERNISSYLAEGKSSGLAMNCFTWQRNVILLVTWRKGRAGGSPEFWHEGQRKTIF
jgi:hypothetical protein